MRQRDASSAAFRFTLEVSSLTNVIGASLQVCCDSCPAGGPGAVAFSLSPFWALALSFSPGWILSYSTSNLFHALVCAVFQKKKNKSKKLKKQKTNKKQNISGRWTLIPSGQKSGGSAGWWCLLCLFCFVSNLTAKVFLQKSFNKTQITHFLILQKKIFSVCVHCWKIHSALIIQSSALCVWKKKTNLTSILGFCEDLFGIFLWNRLVWLVVTRQVFSFFGTFDAWRPPATNFLS